MNQGAFEMANIKIDDLYPIHGAQVMNEITDGVIKSINGGFFSRRPVTMNNPNDESLGDTFALNLDGFLGNLRSQMNSTISTARDQVSNNLDFL